MAEIRCLTNRYDNSRTGANLQETALKPSNVGPTSFGKLFTRPVDGQIYSQPLYAADIQTNRGRLNLLYVATMHNSVYAFEADDPAASAPIWRVSLGPSAPLPDPNIGPSGYRDIAVEVGIVSTPVISPDLKTLYVVAFSKDSSGYHHTLHALDPQTGQQLASQLIKETVPGSGDGSSGGELTFTSHRQLQRAALTLANGRIYIAFAAYGDQTPYHGWVIGCDAQTLKPNSVYVTTPNTGLGGIWQAGQGLAVDDSGHLYFMTGNGGFNTSGSDLGDSIVKLNPDLTLNDWFSPFNNQALNAVDMDLGSAGALLLPGTSLLVGGGKEGKLYLLDIREGKMGHFHPNSDSQIVQSFSIIQNHKAPSHHIHGGPAYWNLSGKRWIYVWPENDFLAAWQFDGASFQTTPISKSTTSNPTGVPGGSPGMPGGFLTLSANGSDQSSGIIWASHPYKDDANQEVVAGILRAYQASDLTQELWHSKMNPARDDIGLFAKFCPPTVANGKVYLATFSKQLAVFGRVSG